LLEVLILKKGTANSAFLNGNHWIVYVVILSISQYKLIAIALLMGRFSTKPKPEGPGKYPQ
jgi:hypothetical protein